MKKTYTHWLAEGLMFLVLIFGLAVIAEAQDTNTEPEMKKTVRVEVEITENGKTSTSIQELELNKESINGQLDEMVEEIEMILEEAVQDIEETDLQITIRRNVNQVDRPRYQQNYEFNYDFEGIARAFESNDRPYLGVYLQDAHDDEPGARITGLVSGGAAQANGLQKGDIITSIGGAPVASYEDAVDAISSHEVGEEVAVAYIREGQAQQMIVPLGTQSTTSSYSYNSNDDAPFLGVMSKANHLDGEANGVLLTNIIEGSGAERAGLKRRDIVLSLDGEPVHSHGELTRAIHSHESGDEVALEVIRDGNPQVIMATLGEREEEGHIHNQWQSGGSHSSHSNHCDDYEAMAKKPFLGVVIKGADGKGVEVTEVYDGTTADEIGVEEGDVIRKINGNSVNTVDELIEELSELEVGDEVKVNYVRDGKKKSISGEIDSKAAHYLKEEQRSTENGGSIIRMRLTVEESEIADLSEKSGETLDVNNSLEVAELSYSPNPTSGPVKLQFMLPEAGDLQIMVFDGNGRKVFDQDIRDFSGSYSGDIDLSSEPAGPYFIALTQNGQGKVVRLIKQ